jgi:hypothetical protein
MYQAYLGLVRTSSKWPLPSCMHDANSYFVALLIEVADRLTPEI